MNVSLASSVNYILIVEQKGDRTHLEALESKFTKDASKRTLFIF